MWNRETTVNWRVNRRDRRVKLVWPSDRKEAERQTGSFSKVLAISTFSLLLFPGPPSDFLLLTLISPSGLGWISIFYLLFCSLHFLFISSFIFIFLPQSMISAKMSSAARAATLRSQVAVAKTGSRSISYSALHAQILKNSVQGQRSTLLSTRPPVSQLVSPFAALPLTRSFHVATPLFQQQQKEQQKEEKKQGKESKSEQEGEDFEKKEKKEDAPPPPPHGDKSPWQVFRETLQTEFKASKEWNESTKALASSAHQFSENENIKRARAAYEAASGAAGTRTSAAFKSTGQVIGKSAAWTWNTTAVKGLRKGVNATGEGLEKATRPVRETEAYKSVKDAIDDGSSSRYGGWVEKEERRKARQLREEQELKSGKRSTEVPVEDPEYVSPLRIGKKRLFARISLTYHPELVPTLLCTRIPLGKSHGVASRIPTL